MKKSYNTPETQLHVMDAQDGFLQSVSQNAEFDADKDGTVNIPGQNQKLFDFEW